MAPKNQVRLLAIAVSNSSLTPHRQPRLFVSVRLLAIAVSNSSLTPHHQPRLFVSEDDSISGGSKKKGKKCKRSSTVWQFYDVVTNADPDDPEGANTCDVGKMLLAGTAGSLSNCTNDLEVYGLDMILTYSTIYHDGTITYGGYSDTMVANERYIIRFPKNVSLEANAPLLCSGITIYSPLKYFGFAEVAVKFAKAFGTKVTMISTSIGKKEEALEHLGADSFLLSRDQEQVQAAKSTMDGIIDTVFASHPILPLIDLLKTHRKLVLLGAAEKPLELPVFPLLIDSLILSSHTTFYAMKKS
ncbi:hypothetical protein FH972_017553 [Carpinus fangiana]|uniref:Alcohol dehydrogenase-like C-terminal domain-containing protein n=1 Tax=Carpinus fangiana TaxID=176857 RepID=A0A5N6RJ87_9ROSI|nr:hypothetical protein FH972_017553 [Carpinus fangiana]